MGHRPYQSDCERLIDPRSLFDYASLRTHPEDSRPCPVVRFEEIGHVRTVRPRHQLRLLREKTEQYYEILQALFGQLSSWILSVSSPGKENSKGLLL
jgi:hypothetical protein